MEALVALGLASNVIQFVDFGIKAASKCHEIYKHGATIEQQNLQSTATTLLDLSGRLQMSLQGAGTHKHLGGNDSVLLELASDVPLRQANFS